MTKIIPKLSDDLFLHENHKIEEWEVLGHFSFNEEDKSDYLVVGWAESDEFFIKLLFENRTTFERCWFHFEIEDCKRLASDYNVEFENLRQLERQ